MAETEFPELLKYPTHHQYQQFFSRQPLTQIYKRLAKNFFILFAYSWTDGRQWCFATSILLVCILSLGIPSTFQSLSRRNTIFLAETPLAFLPILFWIWTNPEYRPFGSFACKTWISTGMYVFVQKFTSVEGSQNAPPQSQTKFLLCYSKSGW